MRATRLAVLVLGTVVFVARPSAAQLPACEDNLQVFSAGSIQSFVVPPGVSTVTVEALGAGGGAATGDGTVEGGLAAVLAGDVPVVSGETLTIIVGQMGGDGDDAAGGGGGASAVVRASGFVPLLVAGGGGGAGAFSENSHAITDASLTTTAKAGDGDNGGAAGAGTLGGGAGPQGGDGAGGAGLTGDGGDVPNGATGGFALNGTAAGGDGDALGGFGGFGGGGGAGGVGGGGGGGYAGGGGGNGEGESSASGGGGSTFADASVSLIQAPILFSTQTDGEVLVCWLNASVVEVPALDTRGLAGLALLIGAAALWLLRRG